MDHYELLVKRIGKLEDRNCYLEELSKNLLKTLFEQEEELAQKHDRIIELETELLRRRSVLLNPGDDTTFLN